MPRLLQHLPGVLFFFSGCASLIFETLCGRRLALVIGSTVQSASATVSAFLFGLGLGAHLGGVALRRSKNPVKLFAVLEACAGLGALVVLSAIPHLPKLLVPLHQSHPYAVSLVRIALVFLLLLLPACAMGASLPVLAHYYVENLQHRFVASLGTLYAINTLGAACGVLVTDFFLVKHLGVTKTGWVSCALYLTVAALATLLTRVKKQPPTQVEPPAPPEGQEQTFLAGVVVLTASGFCGLTFQVLWTRMLTFFNGNDAFAFSTTLAVYLLGLVFGSIIVAQLGGDRWKRVDLILGWLLVVFGLAAYLSLFSMTLVKSMRTGLDMAGLYSASSIFLSSGIVMLPATVCLGLLFPLAARTIRTTAPTTGDAVGRAYILNTIGSVLGALLAGYVLLPNLGLQRSLVLTAALTILAGAGLVVMRSRRRLVALVGPLLFALVLFLTPQDYLLKTFHGDLYNDILYAVDDHYGSIVLSRSFDPVLQDISENLLVDGFNMAGNTPTAKRYTTGLAALPILLTESPKEVLIVCMGLGNTLNTALNLKQTEHVQCVELSRRIPEALALTEIGPSVLNHPKLDIEFGDGRNHLQSTTRRYDVISAEPPPPTHAGIVNLYSKEYYELCAQRLTDDGIVAQWLPVFQLSAYEAKTIIAAFQEVFPHTYLWESAGHQLVLLGKKRPLNLDYQRLSKAVEINQEFLKDSGWHRPPLVAALSIAGPEQLQEYTKAVPPLTDDWPLIQYSSHNFLPDKEFFFFAQRDRDLDWKNASPEELVQIARFRKAVLAFHLYSNLDPRYQSMSTLERHDLAGFTLEVMPGDSYFQTRFLVTPARLDYARSEVKKHPDSAQAFHELARVLFLNGRFEEALQPAAKAASLPSANKPLFELYEILIMVRAGQEQKARERFQQLSPPPSADAAYLERLLGRLKTSSEE